MAEKTKNTLVLIDLETSSPIAFLNVVEDDDRWDKIKGCENCPVKLRNQCCPKCSALESDGTCRFQNEANAKGIISGKSLLCITNPTPKLDDMYSPCQQQFKCVEGSSKIKGLIRRVEDKRYQLRDYQGKIVEKLPAKEK